MSKEKHKLLFEGFNLLRTIYKYFQQGNALFWGWQRKPHFTTSLLISLGPKEQWRRQTFEDLDKHKKGSTIVEKLSQDFDLLA